MTDTAERRQRGRFMTAVFEMARVQIRRDAISRLLLALTIACFNVSVIYATLNLLSSTYELHPEYGTAGFVFMLAGTFYDLLRRWDARSEDKQR